MPRDLWILLIASNRYPKETKTILKKFPLDIGWPRLDPSFEEKYTQGNRLEIGIYVDEWGCVFQNIQGGIIGEVKEPLIKSLSDVNKVRPPYEFLKEKIKKVTEDWQESDKFILGGSFSVDPFERMQFLRGTAELYL